MIQTIAAVRHETCPFCKTPIYDTEEDNNARIMKRVKANDANALYNLGTYYDLGQRGFPRDSVMAHKLWHQAGKLGRRDAYYSIGIDYMHGSGGRWSGKRYEKGQVLLGTGSYKRKCKCKAQSRYV